MTVRWELEKRGSATTYVSYIGDAGFNQLFGSLGSFCGVFDGGLCLVQLVGAHTAGCHVRLFRLGGLRRRNPVHWFGLRCRGTTCLCMGTLGRSRGDGIYRGAWGTELHMRDFVLMMCGFSGVRMYLGRGF